MYKTTNRLLNYLFSLNRRKKQLLLFGFDSAVIPLIFAVAFFARSESLKFLYQPDTYLGLAILLLSSISIFSFRGLYSALTRYVSTDTVITIVLGSTASALLLLSCIIILDLQIPRSTPIIFASQVCMVTISFRFIIRSIRHGLNHNKKKNIAILGAGITGKELLESLKDNTQYRVKLMIDDDKTILGQTLGGIPVKSLDTATKSFKELKIETLLVASPHQSAKEKRRILEILSDHPLKIKSIPSINSLISGTTDISSLNNTRIEELLGRELVKPNEQLMKKNIAGKTVLVTGAGGSIGSELCRQIYDWAPNNLILLDLSEFSIYKLLEELKNHPLFMPNNVTSLIGSVQDKTFVDSVFDKFAIDTVYHAAAYKHVPLMEQNVMQCVSNNVFGTLYMAEAAIASKAKSFTLISTDKAVNATNFMGASKRIAELICQTLSTSDSETCFSTVRFGNVLDSSGSVVPLFKDQIERGGPITLTHADIERYFMTIPEAAQLVIQASSMAKEAKTFVLDMGKPMKILDLAKNMVTLTGLKPVVDKEISTEPGTVTIKVVGLRPGEKLYEEISFSPNLTPTIHPRIMTTTEQKMDETTLRGILSSIQFSIKNQDYQKLFRIVHSVTDGITDINSSSDQFVRPVANNSKTMDQ